MDRGAHRDCVDQPSPLALMWLLSLYFAVLAVAMLPPDRVSPEVSRRPPAALPTAHAPTPPLPIPLAQRRPWWQRHAALAATRTAWWQRLATSAIADEPWWRRQSAVAAAGTGWWRQQALVADARGGWWRDHSTVVVAAAGDGWWARHQPAAADQVAMPMPVPAAIEPVVAAMPAPDRIRTDASADVPAAIEPVVAAVVPDDRRNGLMLSLAGIASPVVSGLSRFGRMLTRGERDVPVPDTTPPGGRRAWWQFDGADGGAADATLSLAPARPTPTHQCLAHDIAGWTGEQLDDARRQWLQQVSLADAGDEGVGGEGEIGPALLQRLHQRGFAPGAPLYLRIFKDSSSLEVWLKRGNRYDLFQRYDICRWSGTFGPKLYEGDRQSPEGYYLVDDQLYNRRSWKWKNSFTINYPNAYDKLHGRTGSLILVHGGCTSSGCFAMTNPVIEEVHQLAAAARENGQDVLHVGIYPFPLTAANMRKYGDSPWQEFWQNLKQGYDLFEATHLPPQVRVCDGSYRFAPGEIDATGETEDFPEGCRALVADIPGWRQVSARNPSSREARGSRLRRTAGPIGCNLARASCRKWAALAGNRQARAQRSARRERLLKSAYSIGKRK